MLVYTVCVWHQFANKDIRWDKAKNAELAATRGVSFEDVRVALESGEHILATYPHLNSKKYAHQFVVILSIRGYAYVIPFVAAEDYIFLKTIYPSRRATQTDL
jgi:uncharacterized DUF497 family protein